MTAARPMLDAADVLGRMGVLPRQLARWQRELERCTTGYQVRLTEECHRMEAYIVGRWGR